ncbi:MAG: hypothetical protein AB1742_08260 [bacterium]
MAAIDLIATGSYTVYIAAGLYRSGIWLELMNAAFEAADRERDPLAANGPWTARTNSLERYAVVDTYA